MQIADLNEAGLDRHLLAIAQMIRDVKLDFDGDVEHKRLILEEIVHSLDALDQDDCLGTEGWRHRARLD